MWISLYNAKEWKRYHEWHLHERNGEGKEFISFKKTPRNIKEKSAKRYDSNSKEDRIEEKGRNR